MRERDLSRRAFLASSSGAAAMGTGPFFGMPGAASRRPNIIIILADDLGYADLGFQGCKDIPTPNIDRLAQGGVRFRNGYVSHPFCSPTRAGLLTGRYQQRFGHENNPRYDPADEIAGLPTTEVTLPQVLREAGYRTGIVGKWHLGAAPKFHPMRRGFDEMFGFLGGGHDYFRAEMQGKPREYLIPIQRDGRAVEERDYLTDAFSREAEAFVRRNRAKPFFLYLAYNAPHTPQQAPEKYLARFPGIRDEKRKLYAAMLAAVDDGVGRVCNALRDTGVANDTLVFFLSDNGGPVGINGSSNSPLRGSKGQVYEGGIRVPFVAWWPGRLAAGRQSDEPVISLDIFATAAALAGARIPSTVPLDGINLMPYLAGEKKEAPQRRLFWRTGGGASYAVREGPYKLVRIGDREPELYDLSADVEESNNLAARRPELVKQLMAACRQWNSELAAPLFESPRPAARRKKAP